MKVLLTGSTGFLGRHILNAFRSHQITTLNRQSGDILCDLESSIPEIPNIDLVVHCAGKAHVVPKTDLEKQAFFDVNLKGTAHLIEGLESCASKPKYFVLISTVAVYGCDRGLLINERSPLAATDAYGKSKILAEKMIQDWCLKQGVVCTILRLPLIVGDYPPGNLGAMIQAIRRGYYFNIAGGKAKKSMVLATDVAEFIPEIAAFGGVYNLTDGYHPSFDELANAIAKCFGKKKQVNMPMWIAKILGYVGDILGSKAPINSNKLNKIVSDLTFDDAEARDLAGWKPNAILNHRFVANDENDK